MYRGKKMPLKSTSADCWKWEMVVPGQGTHEVTLICTEIEWEREIHRSHDINFPWFLWREAGKTTCRKNSISPPRGTGAAALEPLLFKETKLFLFVSVVTFTKIVKLI